jgi:uncharacterized protein YbjT (DUF2867 family)
MRILIAGATGAIGRPLLRRLRAHRHEVFALSRSPDSAPALRENGAEAVPVDVLDAAAVRAVVGRIRPDAVINELTSLPRHYTPAEMKAAAERGLPSQGSFTRMVSLHRTFVYKPCGMAAVERATTPSRDLERRGAASLP